jgi:hypothetical protein
VAYSAGCAVSTFVATDFYVRERARSGDTMLESDKCLYLGFGIPRSGVIENSRRIIELLRIRALVRAASALPVLLAACPQSFADPAPAIHYAPAENLERIDVALIDKAAQEIDMAAYVLTDWPVLQALTRAAIVG